MVRRILTAVPGIGAALLPNVTCPACWPAYAAILSSLGLGFLMQGPYFLLVIGVLLGISMVGLAYRAKTRRGYGPLFIGLTATAVIVAGKLLTNSNLILYAGGALLVGASVWNNWPIRRSANESDEKEAANCPRCKVSPRKQ